MTNSSLKLVIGNKNYSSWSLRAWLVLKQAGLEFEEIRIPLYVLGAKEQILQYSPSGKVPVLIDGDKLIWDSLAIAEYVAERVPDCDLLPADSYARAVARSVSAEMHSGFVSLRSHMPMDCRARRPGKGMTPEVAQDIDRIKTIWRECRQAFGMGGDFLFGQFTIADAMFAPVVMRLITYGVPLDAVAQSYSDAIVSLPAMQQWLADAATETEVIADEILFPA